MTSTHVASGFACVSSVFAFCAISFTLHVVGRTRRPALVSAVGIVPATVVRTLRTPCPDQSIATRHAERIQPRSAWACALRISRRVRARSTLSEPQSDANLTEPCRSSAISRMLLPAVCPSSAMPSSRSPPTAESSLVIALSLEPHSIMRGPPAGARLQGRSAPCVALDFLCNPRRPVTAAHPRSLTRCRHHACRHPRAYCADRRFDTSHSIRAGSKAPRPRRLPFAVSLSSTRRALAGSPASPCVPPTSLPRPRSRTRSPASCTACPGSPSGDVSPPGHKRRFSGCFSDPEWYKAKQSAHTSGITPAEFIRDTILDLIRSTEPTRWPCTAAPCAPRLATAPAGMVRRLTGSTATKASRSHQCASPSKRRRTRHARSPVREPGSSWDRRGVRASAPPPGGASRRQAFEFRGSPRDSTRTLTVAPRDTDARPEILRAPGQTGTSPLSVQGCEQAHRGPEVPSGTQTHR